MPYTPESLNIKAPSGGFQTGGWYEGRQYWGGTLSDPGAIHPASDQQGAGQLVSQEVNRQSAQQQGVSSGQFEGYLQQQRQQQPATATPVKSQTVAQTQTSGMTEAGQTGATGMPEAEAPLDLPELHKTLIASSGVKGLEEKYSQMERDFIEAKGKNNDNPFLSEATRVGREAKLQKLFDERTANIRGDIATQKADIEMELNLAMKQFDINSQVAQQALNQFNSLLSAGALDNATGEDIAALTRQTGISSSMIRSAISVSRKSKEEKANTQVITSTAENGEVFAVVINTDTGDVIKRSSLGVIGNVQGGDGQTATEKKEEEQYQTTQNLTGDVQRGSNLKDLVAHYVVPGGLSAEEVYRIYNTNSPYGSAKESIEKVKEGKFGY